eukprot:gene9508-biopygen1684
MCLGASAPERARSRARAAACVHAFRWSAPARIPGIHLTQENEVGNEVGSVRHVQDTSTQNGCLIAHDVTHHEGHAPPWLGGMRRRGFRCLPQTPNQEGTASQQTNAFCGTRKKTRFWGARQTRTTGQTPQWIEPASRRITMPGRSCPGVPASTTFLPAPLQFNLHPRFVPSSVAAMPNTTGQKGAGAGTWPAGGHGGWAISLVCTCSMSTRSFHRHPGHHLLPPPLWEAAEIRGGRTCPGVEPPFGLSSRQQGNNDNENIRFRGNNRMAEGCTSSMYRSVRIILIYGSAL